VIYLKSHQGESNTVGLTSGLALPWGRVENIAYQLGETDASIDELAFEKNQAHRI